MALQLPRNKKIQDEPFFLKGLNSSTQNALTIPLGNTARPVIRNQAPVAPVRGINTGAGGFKFEPINFGKTVASGIQQSAGNLADVSVMGGAALGDFADMLRGRSAQQRMKNFQTYENLRTGIKKSKTVTGESFNPKEDFQFTGDPVRDASTLAGRSLQTGLDATMFANPTRLAIGSTGKMSAKETARFIGRDSAFFGGGQGTATGLETYGQTGDVKKAIEEGAKSGITSAVAQGAIEGAAVGLRKGAVKLKDSYKEEAGRAAKPMVEARLKPEPVDMKKYVEDAEPISPTYKDSSGKTVSQGKIETSVDPNDPFNNRSILQRMKNDFGERFNDDAKMMGLLRRVERETGRKGLLDQYEFDTGKVRKASAIADARLMRDENVKAALSGLGDFTKPGRLARKAAGLNTKSDLDRFDDYLIARAESTNYKGKSTSRSKAESRRIVQEGRAEFEERFKAVNRYYQAQAEQIVAAGIKDKAWLAMAKKNGNYIRLQRDVEDLVNPGFSTSTAPSLKSTSTAQKRRGSKRQALSPTRTLLERGQQIELEIQRNNAATNTIDMLKDYGLTKRYKGPPDEAKANTIGRFVNGKKELYEVPKDIAEVMGNVKPEVMGMAAKVISAPVRLVRAGATGLSVPFAAKNFLRDQVGSGIQSNHILDTHNPYNIVSAFGSAARDFGDESTHPLWAKFEEFTGNQTQFDELRNVKSTNQALRELRRGTAGRFANRVISPVRTLEDAIGITEKATRFQNFKGTYAATLRKTGDEAEALKQATLAARRNSTDFSRSGDFTRTMNLFIPFFNAAAQGSRQLAITFRKRPVATSAKVLSTVTFPALAAVAYNYADEERRKAYESIDQFEKSDNWIIIGPGAEQQPDGSWTGVIKIPKPPGYRELVDPLQDVAEQFFRGEDPRATADMLGDILSSVSGTTDLTNGEKFIGSVIPQQLKPTVQLVSNKNFYSGKNVVPEFMLQETDDPTERAYDSTSGTMRKLAKELGVSPIQLEQFVKDTTASVGQYGLNVVDRVAAATGQIPEDQVGGKDAVNDLVTGFTKAQGELTDDKKTEGRKYMERRAEYVKKLNVNEQKAYDTLHPKKKNFLGESILDDDSTYNSAARLDVYNRFPKVFELDKKLDADSRKDGSPGNPLFDLEPWQVKKVLEKDNLPDGAKDPELSKLRDEEWYADYANKKTEFFDAIKTKTVSDLADAEAKGDEKRIKSLSASVAKFNSPNNPYPETAPDVQQAMDYYNALPKGTGERSSFIKNNPEMWAKFEAAWEATDQWQNRERNKRGLASTEGSTGESLGFKEDTSSSYSKGGGSGGGGRKGSGGAGSERKYVVSTKGKEISKPKVTAKKASAKSAKGTKVAKPKVTSKKSKV